MFIISGSTGGSLVILIVLISILYHRKKWRLGISERLNIRETNQNEFQKPNKLNTTGRFDHTTVFTSSPTNFGTKDLKFSIFRFG